MLLSFIKIRVYQAREMELDTPPFLKIPRKNFSKHEVKSLVLHLGFENTQEFVGRFPGVLGW